VTAYSTDPDSPFAERPMPPHFEPNALDLAKVAAALDPQLAKQKPAEAVRIARNLISAAQDDIEEPYRRHSDEVNYWDRKKRRRKRLFLTGECVSLAEAHRRWKGKYKTPEGFERALRKRDLITRGSNGEELTSKKAVDELKALQKEDEKARDRRRTKVPKKNLQKNRRGIGEQKRGTKAIKTGTPRPKTGVLATKPESVGPDSRDRPQT
jgi:hypothetical protein